MASKTIISSKANYAAQDAAAAAVPAGSLVKYSYPFGGKIFFATGKVVKAEGSQLHVEILSHDEFPEYVGKTMSWSVCWCSKV